MPSEMEPDSDSVRRISERFAKERIPNRLLTNLEFQKYKRRFTAGWQITATFPDTDRRIDLLVGRDAPWQPPRLALVDPPEFLTWPHVEPDGVLCLLPNSASIDPNRPDDVAMAILASGAELIEELSTGKRDGDFKDEFCTYWAFSSNFQANRIYTLLEPRPPSRTISTWIGEGFTVVGESDGAIKQWLRNRFPKIKDRDLETRSGVLVWLDEPPIPAMFPKRGSDLVALAKANGTDFIELALPIARALPAELAVILGAKSKNGPGFLGISIPHPDLSRFTKGFRPNMMPAALTARRFLEGRTVRTKAERADWSWVHGRDQDQRAAILRESVVSIIGCGSVGAAVATMLASAGVGNLLFVDPDQLGWANIGRHVLGSQSIGVSKARAMADYLTSRFPHIGSVDFCDDSWEDALQEDAHLFDKCNLIISATGDWGSESHLNHWRRTTKPELCVVFGWTEAHGCAGHAIAIRDTGCLQCGFDSVGKPHLQVASWPEGETIKHEPACGAAFQPYGPVELMHVTAMISELAMDCLLGAIDKSTHRIWAGSSRLLASTGGVWTPEWSVIAKDRHEGSFVEELCWPSSSTCRRCFPEAA